MMKQITDSINRETGSIMIDGKDILDIILFRLPRQHFGIVMIIVRVSAKDIEAVNSKITTINAKYFFISLSSLSP